MDVYFPSHMVIIGFDHPHMFVSQASSVVMLKDVYIYT